MSNFGEVLAHLIIRNIYEINVQWKQKIIPLTVAGNADIYKVITQQVGTQEIVIIVQNQICISKTLFFQILEGYKNMELPIFKVYLISEILKLEEQLNQNNQKTNCYEHERKIQQLEQIIEQHQGEIKHLNRQISQVQGKNNQQEIIKLEKQNGRLVIQSKSAYLQKMSCQFCNQVILSEVINLGCRHHYHDECFGKLIQMQLDVENPFFNCLCGNKIKQKEIYGLSNQFAAQIYIIQMLENQIQIIKKTNSNFRQCRRDTCQFFYYLNRNQRVIQTYCPLCNE